ncbi:hypothetical protein ACFWGE_14410 [Streptomyces bacillaris]|uniref:Secreted protein n=1 Tax=Streptomyces cavourensis TaxID=67258 RepID=A0ABY5FF78_9ACTN|nr:hypothetical protein [Streptomyces cavourensis]ATY95972.1 hypothetical protein CVT27_11160 [Streptomyces cavourensis]TQO30451.1 hypothetical protein FHX79_112279 [Streptomyces cavourensis]UTR82223.1 hypothetical protein NLU04_28980 [Streptomyces cavourensis]GGU67402.1 hypothetical protein GCM10010498_26190 [Streptomyces cavourensis]
MPRPTAAQLVYGSATVVCTTLALLLLSGTESGIGVAIAATTGLALGLLVAVRLPQPAPQPRPAADHPRTAPAGAPTRTHHLPDAFGAQERVPAARPGRQDEHSLRR